MSFNFTKKKSQIIKKLVNPGKCNIIPNSYKFSELPHFIHIVGNQKIGYVKESIHSKPRKTFYFIFSPVRRLSGYLKKKQGLSLLKICRSVKVCMSVLGLLEIFRSNFFIIFSKKSQEIGRKW